MKKALLLSLFAGILLNAQAQVKMMVLSDPHVLDTTLYDGQASFSSDPKLVEHSLELFDIALGRIVTAQPDILLIPGDLTKDGELASHEYVAQKLNALNGIRVFVVPGNHDLTNPTAESFFNGSHQKVANVNAAQFRSIYANMGYGNAALYSPDSLSYLAWANDTLAILGLNSTQPNTTSRASAGGLDNATLDFVDNAMAVVRQHGGQVIAMMHHQLVEHFDGEATAASTYVCNTDTNLYISRDSVHRRLMQAGISVMLTGHFHIHSIQRVLPTTIGISDTLPPLTDISTGALCSWASPIRTLVLNGEELAVTTDTIGKYQTKALARNQNTLNGAINTMGPKLYTQLPALLTSPSLPSIARISQASIDKIMPASAAEMTQLMHHYFDVPGAKLLNTLARGDEEAAQHLPYEIHDELTDSINQLIWHLIPELNPYNLSAMSEKFGLGDALKLTTIVPRMQEIMSELIYPIVYNYTIIGGLTTERLLELLLSEDGIPQEDKDYVPDWNYTATVPHYTAQTPTELPASPTGFSKREKTKTLHNGVIVVRSAEGTFGMRGERL